MEPKETVTVSVERYNDLVAMEKDYERMKTLMEKQRFELSEKVKSLYSLEYIEAKKEMYVQIDKLNLLGMLNLNFKKEDSIRQVYFEFHDRGIFFDERRRF